MAEHAAAALPSRRGDRYRDLAPDRLQILVATLLLGLALMPLLRWLDLQVSLFVVGLLGLRLATLRWPGLRLARLALFLLTVLGLFNVIDTYRAMAGQDAGTALLVTMSALKLLEARNRRDLHVLGMVYVFLLVVLFLFDKSLGLTIWLLPLLIANVALMADLNGTVTAPRLRRAARTALVLTAQALPLALLLFVLFPRLDSPLWDLGLSNQRAISGLKDWLEPGSVGELVISGEDAFRVRFDQPPGLAADRLYWRGPVLWRTDGQRWLPLASSSWPTPSTPAPLVTGAGRAAIVPVSAPIDYTVVMEPTEQRWLIALDLPLAVPDDAWITQDFQVLVSRPITDWRLYRMTSVVTHRTTGPDDLPETRLDPKLAAMALQLPDNVTPRMRALVAGWQREAAEPRAVVDRALKFFNAPPFRYTLLPPVLGNNPADEFLFETQSGFCEHYASSFVLLMRSAGIPSRIVLGYLGGDFNALSGDYLVRQSDAHAWAEVWLDGAGWVRVDPTAAIAPERVDQDARMAALGAGAPVRFRLGEGTLLARVAYNLRTLAGAVDAGWKYWIIGFSSIKQRRLLDQLGLGRWREYGLALLLVVLGGSALLILSLALGREREQRDAATRCFAQACARLARIGLPRAPSEGPLDYRARVVAARPDLAAGLDAILQPYLALHYRDETEREHLARLREQVRAFRPRRRPRTTRAPV